MPTIRREGPYRIHFYPKDETEPPHVHVDRDNSSAKVWLAPLRVQSSRGYRRTEILQIERIVENYREELVEAWNDFFNR